MAGHVPTASISALYANTTPGTVADPAAIDNAVADIVQTTNDNYDALSASVAGLISGQGYVPLGIINVKAAPYNAVGDGVTDDYDSINSAIVSMSNSGGILIFPYGTYKISQKLVVNKPIHIIGFGATIKPSVDIDVIQITHQHVRIDGLTIDGGDIASGSGNGIVIGGDELYAMGTILSQVVVRNTPGNGIVWEQGSMVIFDYVEITGCQGDGMVFTSNYDDNNHGRINVHIVNCGGRGIRILHDAVTAANSSRHHVFLNTKVFGCSAGGVYIETRDNIGTIFLELNGGTQLELTSTSKANHLQLLGVPLAYDGHVDSGSGNVIEGVNIFDRWETRIARFNESNLRNVDYVGSLTWKVTGDNDFSLQAADTTSDVTVDVERGTANSLTFGVQRFRIGSGTVITKHSAATSSLNFGTIPANGSVDRSVSLSGSWYSDTVRASPNTEGNAIPAGLVWSAFAANGVITVRVANVTGADISMPTIPWTVEGLKR